MNLQEHEVICSKCKGEELLKKGCDKCGGKGKLDWVSNAMSRKVTLVTPGVYTQEIDLSSYISPFIPKDEVTFHNEGEELIRLTKDGFYVKGKKVAEDKKIYDAFVDFLSGVGTYK